MANISDEKLATLMTELKSNKDLAKKLGLLEDESSSGSQGQKRNGDKMSPIRLKKVRCDFQSIPSSSKTSKPIQQSSEDSAKTLADPSDQDQTDSELNDSHSSHPESGKEGDDDDLDDLELGILRQKQKQVKRSETPLVVERSSDASGGSDLEGEVLEVLGASSQVNWKPSKKLFDFIKKQLISI